MGNGKIWMGTLYPGNLPGTSIATVNARMGWVPAPDTGMEASSEGWSEFVEFYNGGADVVSSTPTRKHYDMQWGLREASGPDGLDQIKWLSQKMWGPGLIYWANPMNFSTNCLPPAWAAPGLIEQGWKNISTETPTFSATATNVYSLPKRKATFDLTGAANAAPTLANQIAVLAIPPTHVLNLGFSGSFTGDALLRVRPINTNGNYAAAVYPALLSETGAQRMNATFSGALYKAVEIYFVRSTTNPSTITISSGMAQLWPIGYSVNLNGNFIPGNGDTGCKFVSPAIPESYVVVDDMGGTRHLKGMSAPLVEVGAWQT